MGSYWDGGALRTSGEAKTSTRRQAADELATTKDAEVVSMDEVRRGFAKLNLVAASATELSVVSFLSSSSGSTQDGLSLLKDGAQGGPRPVSFSSYTPRGKERRKHSLIAGIVAPDDEQNHPALVVRYTLDDPAPTAAVRRSQRPAELLSRLQGWSFERPSICNVVFRFNENAVGELWFPLPTRLAEGQGTDGVVEVRGIRGARFTDEDDEEPEFTFIMDRAGGKDVFLDLQFPVDQTYDYNMPRSALVRAREIARTLVRPLRKRGQ